MEQERPEAYERIPWETLERRSRDPNRMVIAVAGAVVLGALAFSFARDRPSSPVAQVATTSPAAEIPQVPQAQPMAPVPTLTAPLVVAEADLYAVHEEHLHHLVAAHAEWFAVEYFAFDGSDRSRSTLASLLPEGVPHPEAPQGVQVFVDWARAASVSEIAPLLYEVEVIVRSLVSGPEGGFTRQATRMALLEVTLGDDGSPRVTRPPGTIDEPAAIPHQLILAPVPDQVSEAIEATHGVVVGGEALPGGGYRVVVMVSDPDGVTRPRTVVVP